MNVKTLIAGVAGGIVLFIWGSIVHLATPLASMGMSSLPNEDAVLEVMRANITQPGLYFFPGIDPAQMSDEAAIQAWDEKAKRGPTGIMVYQLHGEGMLPLGSLMTEAVSNILVGLLVALVLAQISGSLLMRASMAGVIALIASADILFSEWNWYKFPTEYAFAQTVMIVVGYLLMGATIAAIAKKP